MAKTGVRTKAEAKLAAQVGTVRQPEVFFVRQGEVDFNAVVRANAEGKKLLFDSEQGFMELTEPIVRSLSMENRRLYKVAEELHRAWDKSPQQDYYGEGVEILNPGGNHIARQMEFLERPKDAHVYFADARMVDSAKMQGYRPITKDMKAFVPFVRNQTDEKGHVVTRTRDGKVESVAMWIEEDKYQASIHKAAKMSRQRQEEQIENSKAKVREAGFQVDEANTGVRRGKPRQVPVPDLTEGA